MLWAQSTTKDYIRAEHKLHSISKLFISQVIKPQVMFLFFVFVLFCVCVRVYVCVCFGLFTFRGHSTREPASSSVTYFILLAYTGRKNWERVWKKCRRMDRNGRNKQGRKPLAVSVACTAIYWPTPGFKGRTFSSVFSPDGTLISASAAPHCGACREIF